MSLNVKSSVEVNTSSAQASINNLTNALNKFNEQGKNTSEALNKIANNTNKFIDKIAHLSQAIAGIWGGLGKVKEWSNEFIKTAYAINTMNARLAQTTTSTAHFTALRAEIDKIAKSTYSSSESISNLFINVNQSLSEMGLSQKNALEMSETLSKALKVGGASAVDAERAITQFSQALSTGKLQGQDFKAMIQAALAAEGAMTNLQTRILERIHSRIH